MWNLLALLATGLGAVGTWWAFTRRGTTAGVRALGWALLIPAAWLTGVFTLVGRVATAVTRWTSGIVLSFGFGLGLGLGALAIALILLAAFLRSREDDAPAVATPRAARRVRASQPRARGAAPTSAAPTDDAADDGLGDIEELLRRRGIE